MQRSLKPATKIRVWVREVSITEQVFWCLIFTASLVLSLALAIALCRFGVVGGVVIGFALCKLLQG